MFLAVLKFRLATFFNNDVFGNAGNGLEDSGILILRFPAIEIEKCHRQLEKLSANSCNI